MGFSPCVIESSLDCLWAFCRWRLIHQSASPWVAGGVLGVVQNGKSLSLWSQKIHLWAKDVFCSHPTEGSFALGRGRKDRRTETDSENMPSSTTCRVVTRDAGGLSGVPVTLLVTRARSDCEPPWLHNQPSCPREPPLPLHTGSQRLKTYSPLVNGTALWWTLKLIFLI